MAPRSALGCVRPPTAGEHSTGSIAAFDSTIDVIARPGRSPILNQTIFWTVNFSIPQNSAKLDWNVFSEYAAPPYESCEIVRTKQPRAGASEQELC